jgi:hypothetical protein
VHKDARMRRCRLTPEVFTGTQGASRTRTNNADEGPPDTPATTTARQGWRGRGSGLGGGGGGGGAAVTGEDGGVGGQGRGRGAAGSGEGRVVRLTTGWKASGSCPTGKARQHDGAARTLRNPVDELFTHESGSGTARAHTCPPLSDTRPTPAPSHRPHGRVTAAPSPRSRPRASQPHHRTPDHTRHSSTPLPTHASPHHDHRRPMPEQPLVRAEPHPRPRDLPVTGLAPQLPDQLAHLGDRLRRNRLAEGRETTARVHR